MSSTEKSSDGVAAAYLAAADSFPTLPTQSVRKPFETRLRKIHYPSHSCSHLTDPDISTAFLVRLLNEDRPIHWVLPHCKRSSGTCIIQVSAQHVENNITRVDLSADIQPEQTRFVKKNITGKQQKLSSSLVELYY